MRSAHLVQVFLPLRDPDGARQPPEHFRWARDRLLDAFGGLTAYTRAPAEGLWEAPSGVVASDRVVVYETVCAAVEPPWWSAFRRDLELRFRQQEVLIRCQDVRLL